MITNSGSQRFDIYSGTFDKNDQISASPFTDAFMFIKDLPLGVAQEVLPALNAAGADERRKRDLGSVLQERASEMWKRGYVNMRYMEWLDEMDRRHDGAVKRASQNLTLGYVTSDVSVLSCLRFKQWFHSRLLVLSWARRRHHSCSTRIFRHPGFHWLRYTVLIER